MLGVSSVTKEEEEGDECQDIGSEGLRECHLPPLSPSPSPAEESLVTTVDAPVGSGPRPNNKVYRIGPPN